MAGAVLAAVPSLIVFFLLRKQLLEGLTAGSVKWRNVRRPDWAIERIVTPS